MAYNTVTFQQREKQFRDLNRITKDYGDCASEATDALNAFRKALDGMHDAANRLRCGFSIEGTPTEDEVRRIVGLEVGRVLNTSFTLFSFADFTVTALTAPERIPSLSANAAKTIAALGKALGASHDAADKAADHAAVMKYVEEAKERLRNKEGATNA